MKIRPLKDRLILKRVREEDKTRGGIIIPEIAKEKPVEGEVIAIGEIFGEIEAGDRVIFGKYTGTEVTIDDVEHLFMREDDIQCVIESSGDQG